MRTILLINPNSSAATTRKMAASLRRDLAGDALVTARTTRDGPMLISRPEQLAAADRTVAAQAVPGTCAAVVVGAFGDPGRAALARRLPVPVIGLGQASARAAAATGEAFAVVTTTPDLRDEIDARMRAEAPGAPYLGCEFTEGMPAQVMNDRDRLDRSLIAACERAALAGVSVVVVGGGPLSAAARRIAGSVAVSVLDPLRCAARAVRDVLEADE